MRGRTAVLALAIAALATAAFARDVTAAGPPALTRADRATLEAPAPPVAFEQTLMTAALDVVALSAPAFTAETAECVAAIEPMRGTSRRAQRHTRATLHPSRASRSGQGFTMTENPPNRS